MGKIDTSFWKKFKLSELFGKAKLGKYHNPKMLWYDPDGYEYICASNLNNGVNKDLPKVMGENLMLTASNIIAWGKQCPMFTWHKDPCVTSQGMYYIEFGDLSEECALFIIALLEHACRGRYGYNNCLIGSKFDEIEISLPVTADGQPDWDYMQDYIAELEQEYIVELEQERIAELEQYLVATGLNDYVLTDEDLAVLSQSGGCKEMREFRMGDLFEKLKAPYLGFGRSRDNISRIRTDEFSLPLINCKDGDNGIMYYGRPADFTSYRNVLSIIYNGPPTEGQTYYQPEIGLLSDAYLVRLKAGVNVGQDLGLYLTGAVNKAIHDRKNKRYSRGNKAIWNAKVENDMVHLPVQTDAAGHSVIDPAKTYHPDGFVPDWEYMASYIRAIEKLVIKDVVDFKDAFIDRARRVVSERGSMVEF